jgi:hypothetical protein
MVCLFGDEEAAEGHEQVRMVWVGIRQVREALDDGQRTEQQWHATFRLVGE